MSAYPKTENLYRRNETTHKLIPGAWRNSHFPQIRDWIVSEKIDGTNIRVILDWILDIHGDPQSIVYVRGRSNEAPLPGKPGYFLREAFGIEQPSELLDRLYRALKVTIHGGEDDAELDAKLLEDPVGLILYGEGYGPGIQKGGGDYAPHKSFRAFDLATFKPYLSGDGDGRLYWRSRDELETACTVAGLKTAPLLRINGSSRWSVFDIEEYVGLGVYSRVAAEDNDAGFTVFAEGVIARTDPYLYDGYGHRVMFKLKAKDLPAPAPVPDGG